MNDKIPGMEGKDLEKLSPDDVGRRLMQLPVRQRVELILSRPDTDSLVQAMPDEDFYLTVMEMGPEDSIQLLDHARTGQLNHLFDLEWWRKDEVLGAKSLDWLQKLARAGGEKLEEWLYQADFELLVSLFKIWITVATAPEDIDLVEARDQLPPNTLDDQYFWEARYPQFEQFMKLLLSAIFEASYGFYKELMNSVIFAVDAEIHEEAFRFHRGRLEDHSIPEFYDALEIYRSPDSDEIPPRKELATAQENMAAPGFALALIPEDDFLKEALHQVRDLRLLETLRFELVALANKVVVADQIQFESPEALHRAVEKAAAYVNLGLESLTSRDIPAAVKILSDTFLEYIFRVGQERVGKLKALLHGVVRRGWISRWPSGLKILDPYWLESAELFLGKTPKLLDVQSASGKTGAEHLIRSTMDLGRARHLIETIKSAGAILKACVPDPGEFDLSLWDMAQIRTLDDVTLGTLLWTTAAQFEYRGFWTPEPVPVSSWREIFPKLLPDAMEDLIQARLEKIESDPGRLSYLRFYLAPLFADYREEMQAFDAVNAPDPKFVKSFLFTRG